MALSSEGIIAVPGMLSRWVQLPNGCRAHYMTSGEDGPPVVLMHGGIIGSSGTAGWRFLAPFLGANGFRVYAPDYPGFGLTENYEDVYEAGQVGHVEFSRDFVNAMCLDKVHVSGNSMGCMNAVNFITANPERVISYALIAGGIGDIVPWSDMLARDTRPDDQKPDLTMFDGTPQSMKTLMSAIILDPSKITDDLADMRTAAALRHREYYGKHMQAALNLSPEAEVKLRTKGRFDQLTTIPGIYMYGTEDVLIPHDASGYPQEDALPHVQFFYPENTGHQGQTDSPDLFNKVFLEFFRDGKVSWDLAQQAGISTRREPLASLVAVPDGAKV